MTRNTTHRGRPTLARPLIRRLTLVGLSALLAALLLAVTPAEVFAQDAGGLDGEGLGSSAGIAGDWDWVGLALKLGIVLVAIWAVIVAMRWYIRRSGAIDGGGRHGHLEVIETRALGGQRSLQLVRLGERAVLLGVTPERINTLLEVADPDEFARLTAPPAEDARGRPFSSFIAGIGGSMLAARRATRGRAFGRERAAAGADAARPSASAARARAAAAAYAGMRVVDLERALAEPSDAPRGAAPNAAPPPPGIS